MDLANIAIVNAFNIPSQYQLTLHVPEVDLHGN